MWAKYEGPKVKTLAPSSRLRALTVARQGTRVGDTITRTMPVQVRNVMFLKAPEGHSCSALRDVKARCLAKNGVKVFGGSRDVQYRETFAVWSGSEWVSPNDFRESFKSFPVNPPAPKSTFKSMKLESADIKSNWPKIGQKPVR